LEEPGASLARALARARFFAETPVAGACVHELLAQGLLGAVVGRAHEIRRPLERHLQLLNLAEIALEPAPGLARGLDHDVEEGGVEHCGPRAVDRAGGSARRCAARQDRDCLIASSHGAAAFSPAARTSGVCFCTKSASAKSVAPPALEMRCHLMAATGSAGRPRPLARRLARRFCAIGLPLRAAFLRSAMAACSSLVTPVPLNSAIAYSTCASV